MIEKYVLLFRLSTGSKNSSTEYDVCVPDLPIAMLGCAILLDVFRESREGN